jgi:hypothetical protein
MSTWSISGAILASMGGGALIVAALFRWLGEITAKRILQSEQNAVLISLENLKQELGLARVSYDKHVEHIVDYYSLLYGHYQTCQRTEHADIFRHPEREDADAKAGFMSGIDAFAAEWNSRQGKLRLILPSKCLVLHEELITAFNEFKDAVGRYDRNSSERRGELRICFMNIDRLKGELEKSLRAYLRTDSV